MSQETVLKGGPLVGSGLSESCFNLRQELGTLDVETFGDPHEGFHSRLAFTAF